MLSDRHLAFLAARAVTGPVIERRGYATITDWQALAAAGFPERQAKALVPGLLIPRYGLDGRRSPFPKFRPDPEGRNGPVVNASGGIIKYASPGYSWNFLDALPGTLLTGDIWLSAEGYIKADAMTAVAGFPVLAVDGIYGWMSKQEVVLGLEALTQRHRRFNVVCDSDFDSNRQVAIAMFRLVRWLRSQGSAARLLHPPSSGSKVGVDDWLADGNHLARLVEVPLDEARTRVRNGFGVKQFLAAWGTS